MKTVKYILILSTILSLGLASCGSEQSAESKVPESNVVPPNADKKEVTYKIVGDKSTVKWTGTKLGFYKHKGTLDITKGNVTMKGGEVTGGGMTVDMKSMAATDDNFGEKNPKEALIGHLSQPEFFDTEKFPVSTFIFKDGKSGTLSIKDKVNKIDYSNVQFTDVEGGKKLTASAEFNRQDYGVIFKIGEAIANDMVQIEVELFLSE